MRPRTRKLRVERLESRQLLAGNLRVYVVDPRFGAGDEHLYIQASNFEPAAVTIDQTGNTITITPGPDTTLNYGTSPININVDPLSQRTTFRGDQVHVILRGSENSVAINNLENPNAGPGEYTGYTFYVTALGGADSVAINGKGTAWLSLGNGANTAHFNQRTADDPMHFSGGDDDDFVSADGGKVDAINLLGGNNTLDLTGVTQSWFGWTTYIRAGAGNDTVTIGGSLTTRGDLNIDLGNGANALTMENVTVGQPPTLSNKKNSLYYSGGSDSDTLNLTGGTVLQDALIRLGDGENALNLTGANIGDDLIIHSGAGKDMIAVAGTPAANIGGSFYLTPGHGANELYVHDVMIGKNLMAATGDENDALCLQNLDIGGNLVATLGDGMFNTLVASAVDVALNFTVTGGSGEDNLGFLDSSAMQLTLDTRAGTDGVIVRNFSAGTNVVILAGADSDRLFVDNGVIDSRLYIQADPVGGTGSDLVRVKGASVDGNLRIEAGGGAFDNLMVEDANVGGSLVIIGEEGSERIFISETAGQALFVANDLAITSALADDEVLLSGDFMILGAYKVNGGVGTDNLNTINGAPAPTTVISIEGVSALTEADFDFSDVLTQLEEALAVICGG